MNVQSIKASQWTRRVAWAVAAVLALWVIGWLAVPPILKSQAQKIASAQLGRKVTIGAVDFKPWTLELTLNDLAVATADGAGQQLHIRRIYVNGSIQSLFRLAPVVDGITIDDPSLKLTRVSAGHYDIDDILARFEKPSHGPPGKPVRFALYNLVLSGGSVDFDDKVVGKTQQLRGLTLSVPFLSNLDSKRDVLVKPRLAFILNGSHFDSAAQGTPFAQTRKTDATLQLTGVDLAPYLGYLPASLPVRLQAGVIDADLQVAFEQTPDTSVRISGTVQASHVKLTDAKTQDLLAFDSLKLALTDVEPLAQVAKIAAVELDGPDLAVRRDAAGRLNLDFATPTATARATATSSAQGASAASTPVPGHAASSPWKIEVDKVAVRGGTVAWSDETTAPQARLALHDLVFDAAGVVMPFATPLQFSGSALLASSAAGSGAAAPAHGAAQGGSITFGGSATDRSASVAANVTALPLNLAAPYLASYLEPGVAGQLSAQLNVDWKAPAPGANAVGLQLGVTALTLDNLALTGGKAVDAPSPAASTARTPSPVLPGARQIRVTDARINLDQHAVTVGKVVVTDPHLSVAREADGRWMFERWLKRPAASTTHHAVATTPHLESKQHEAVAGAWKVAIDDIAIDGGAVAYRDAAAPRPVAFDVSRLQVQLKDFSLDGRKPSPLSVSATIGAGRTEPGRIEYNGSLGLSPLSAQGRVRAVRLPLQAFAPYFDNAVNVRLLRADGSFNGAVHYLQGKTGPVVQVTGDSALEDLRADTVAQPAGGPNQPAIPAEPLLRWKALSVRGLDLAMKPGAATRVNVRETALSDFYARININPSGRINLQDLVKPPAQSHAVASKTAAAAPPPVAAASAAPVATANAGPAPVIHIGPISLVNGKVLFSDHFIKPNYSADLSELTGKLSAFSSVAPTGAPQMADLELTGRAEGTASLEITGKLNPLAKPLALDITGKVHDLELPPLSPYAVKYSGHEIERGKMSMDVHYVVLPNGQLTAKNNLVLNQLSFGDEVKGAPASLPVKLAVALLADRDGVINLDLPISGSLNDPQFSLGPIIFKAIVNIIVKAVTAPFSLLANAFGGGGGQQLNTVVFAPGSAALTPQAQAGLDKVAKVLIERPRLKMTVVGAANLDAEREGYRRARLNAMVRAEQRREALLASGNATATAPASAASAPGAASATPVSAADYPALLKRVYRRADITKPRNLIGMAKDIPQAQMESLLMASIPVTEDSMRQLALARGEAVKDYLASRHVPADQLFLGAPKGTGDQAASGVAADAKWVPRADLSLATP